MKGELTVITRVFSYEKGAGTGVSSDKMVASFSLTSSHLISYSYFSFFFWHFLQWSFSTLLFSLCSHEF